MFTSAIFIRPDSEFIRENVCACAKLFVDEENVHMSQIESWKNTDIDENDTKRRIHQALC
jgi:hypothetical protein